MARRLNTPEFNKAFNKAFNNASREAGIKRLKKEAIKRDVNYLTGEGMSLEVAKVFAKSMRDAGINVRLKRGKS